MVNPKAKKKVRTSFGATAPPIIDYLKDILRRYPDGGQILKELIQNADDARATEVVFIHDERSYGTESLWTEELETYQGPALYAYNNAGFTDEDWKGIQRTGRSVKRDDPNRVGRFGIGFNSVYHITDVPSIFSSGHLGMMDPQEKVFGERNGGFRWSLDDAEDQEVLLNMSDQFQPFRDIILLLCGQEWSTVVMEDQHFNGTIFRFPLRNEASEISDNLYDSDKVVELFDSFIADADLSLLFLKNVTSVSLLHISEDGAVNTRLEVKSSVPTDGVLEPEEESVTEGLTRFKVITVSSKDQKETKWLLTTCTMKEGVAEDLDLLTKKLSFLPQVDLAFPCDDQSSVLYQVYNINHSEFSHLSNDDMKEFQIFLQSGLSKSKDNQEYVRKLKSLPIFETTHGERVRIDGTKKVYVLNIEYSVMFPDLLNLPNSNSIFLKFNFENYMLSETVNIQVLKDLQYFMKFILPAVHQLTETQILHSLKLLLSLYYSSEDKKTIISSLKTVKLIRSSQGRLEPASYYFDESVELYKRMLPHERFVPERFWTELCDGDDYTTEKAKKLVRKLGMKHVVSNDEIINFAYQLESEAKGKGRIEDLKRKSSLLFRKALKKACDPKDNNERLLESIADIKFIFPVNIRKELSNYHQPFAAEGTMHNDDMALKVINEVIMTLTKEINVLLGNRIASGHLPVLGQLLMCDDLQDVRKTLAKNQIRDSAETESSSFSPAAPGTEIPEEWHDCLDMNVLNNFEEEEYVGYSIDDKYIYAVIVEELPGHNGRYSWRYKIDIGEDEPIEVSCVDLFQFKREKKVKTERRKCMEPGPQKKTLKPEENTCMELEPLTGAVPHSSELSTNSLPASVEEAKREIDKCLAEIWRLPEEERHKAIKRLYLRWHPDKNLDCQSLASEAFKYLQNQIDELSKPKAAGSTFSSRNTYFRGFYEEWNQEARYHRNTRERFSRGYRGFHSYNFWTHNENVPRPDREEARRWCRQARCDLNAAHKDTGGGSTEWCLFKGAAAPTGVAANPVKSIGPVMVQEAEHETRRRSFESGFGYWHQFSSMAQVFGKHS
nr:PREDICTED: sacsin-like [Pundamilia nyererei]